MKRILFAISLCIMIASCEPAGTTNQYLTGSEKLLPPELKGLKIYSVATEGYGNVKVGILNNRTMISTTYSDEDKTYNFILFDSSRSRKILVDSILSETDDIIVCHKKKN